jgi:hypothetical protein
MLVPLAPSRARARLKLQADGSPGRARLEAALAGATPETPAEALEDSEPLRLLSIHGGELNLNLATKLSLAGLFRGETTAEDRAYMLEAIALTNREQRQSNGTAIRFGVGLRVLFRLTNIKSDVKIGYAAIGAALQLGLSSASYEVLQYGLGSVDSLVTLLQSFSAGRLTPEIFLRLNKELLLSVRQSILEQPDKLKPERIAMRVEPGTVSLLDSARSVIYGVKCVCEERSLSEAFRVMPGGLAREQVARVYRILAGEIRSTDAPGPSATKRARQWFKT